MTLSIPNSFSPSTTIQSSQVNANFNAVATWANGNVGADNFATLGGAVSWSISSNVKAINVSIASTQPAIHVTSSGTGAPLQLDSTTRGMLPPRMTTAQREAIASPAEGELVFDTTLDALFAYTGSAWEQTGNTVESDLQESDDDSGSQAIGASWEDLDCDPVEITTDGNTPVFIGLTGDRSAADKDIVASINCNDTGTTAEGRITFIRNTSETDNEFFYFRMKSVDNSVGVDIPVSSFWMIDVPPAGTHTYRAQAMKVNAGSTYTVGQVKLVAYKLPPLSA